MVINTIKAKIVVQVLPCYVFCQTADNAVQTHHWFFTTYKFTITIMRANVTEFLPESNYLIILTSYSFLKCEKLGNIIRI